MHVTVERRFTSELRLRYISPLGFELHPICARGSSVAASYQIHPGPGTVITNLEGSVQTAELVQYAKLLASDPEFRPHFDQVLDLRRVTIFDVDPDAASAIAPFDPFSARSRWSFVVENALQHGLLRMFVGQAGLDHEYALFVDLARALRWLGLEATLRANDVVAHVCSTDKDSRKTTLAAG